MIRLDQIRSFFPPQLRDNPVHQKYLLKEYFQLMILDFLSSTSYARKIVFIGGTNLRLIKGIDRFLIKIECQDQQIAYDQQMVNIKGCGFFFPFPVPSDAVLTAMKLSALISRQKGRDFYDAMFLLGQSKPDYDFLSVRYGIHNISELKTSLLTLLSTVNLEHKARDFEHLLFDKRNSARILGFKEYVEEL